MLIVGVNGVGKTTTIGKLANQLRQEGRTPLICAADTFRAAAVDQLQIWADRAGVDIVRAQGRIGSGRRGVRRDDRGEGAAARRGAGRHRRPPAHAHQPDERARQDPPRRRAAKCRGAPHEVLLVLDATVGQNGLAQAREFTNVAGVTGIVLTKLDGTAKGGIAVAIAHDLKLPIRYVGVGEGVDDLLPFSPREYVDAIFQEKW